MRCATACVIALIVAGCERSSRTVKGPASTWTLVEDQRVGSVTDDATGFTNIESVIVARDRTVFVQDGGTRVRVVDSAGRVVRTIGRRGAGPGEFEGIGLIGLIGDTLWAADGETNRVTMFDRAGNVLATLSFSAPPLDDWDAPEVPATLTADGSALLIYRRKPPTSSTARMLVRLDRRQWTTPRDRLQERGSADATGFASVRDTPRTIRDTIAILSLETYWIYTPVNMPGSSRPFRVFFFQPLADNVLWSTGHDGMSMVFVDRPAAHAEDSASFGVTKLVYGDTTISRRYQYTPSPVTTALIDSILANTEEGQLGMAREAVYQPGFRPPVTKALLGVDGSVWLEREFSYGPLARWTVIHPGGDIAGELDIPRSQTVRAADDLYVWTTITDENDVPFIVRYRIVKPTTGS